MATKQNWTKMTRTKPNQDAQNKTILFQTKIAQTKPD
jgi:hypothetical protein